MVIIQNNTVADQTTNAAMLLGGHAVVSLSAMDTDQLLL